MTTWGKQLRLLLWKNWVLKKRAAMGTVMEVFAPLSVVLLFVLIRELVHVKHVSAGNYETFIPAANNSQYTLPTRPTDPNVWIPILLSRFACGNEFGVKDYPPMSQIGYVGPEDLLQHLRLSMTRLWNQSFLSGTNIVCGHQSAPPYSLVNISGADYINTQLFHTFTTIDEMKAYTQSDRYTNCVFGSGCNRALQLSLWLQDTGHGQWSYKLQANSTESPPTFSNVDKFATGFDAGDWAKYLLNGVATIMTLVNQFIIDGTTATDGSLQVSLAPMPVPAHKKDNFLGYVHDIIGLFLIFAFLWPFTRLVRNMVDEKERRVKEGLRMMGLSNSAWWWSWALTYIILFTIFSILATIIGSFTLYKYSNPGLVFLVFWLFSLDLVAVGCCLTAVFGRAKTCGVLSGVLILAMYMPMFAVGDDTKPMSAKTAASLMPPVAFSLGQINLFQWESVQTGAQLDNAGESTNNYTLNTALLMMAFDLVLFSALAVYLEQVIPKEFGTHKPWYFLCSPAYWRNRNRHIKDNHNRAAAAERSASLDGPSPALLDKPLLPGMELKDSAGADDERSSSDDGAHAAPQPVVEGVPDDMKVAVRVRHLRKEFPTDDGTNVAVVDLNLSMYEGQVFALLGHNGAGKSTTMHMLTGMLEPTSGTATLEGLDIRTDMDDIRRFTGVCPQHDILFPTMTVAEHLTLYAILKDTPSAQVESAVHQAMDEVQMLPCANQYAGSLSGGQKRRLSLAIALIGDSRVLFLDEPTSGVDPFSRRAIWNLLAHKKKGRVIVLTTHFMDEADQLGDRIAIMHQGALQCVGSSLFLKRTYGVGYTMTLTKSETFNREQLDKLIAAHVPGHKQLSDVGTEISYQLPFEASSSFPELLTALDRKEANGVANYGLSVTTLEEVFLKVADGADAHQKEAVRKMSEKPAEAEAHKSKGRASSVDPELGVDYLDASDNHSTFCRDFLALMTKRWNILKRDRRMACCQFLLPICILLLGFGFLRFPPDFTFKQVEFSPAWAYGTQTPVPFNADNRTAAAMKSFVGNTHDGMPVPSTAQSLPSFSSFLFDSRGMQGQRFGSVFWRQDDLRSFTVLDNVTANAGMPSFLSLAAQIAYREKHGDPTLHIKSTFQPFEFTHQQKETIQAGNGVSAAIVLAIAFSFIPASFVVFLVKEREIAAKHLQKISGLDMTAYWVSSYAWDYCNYLISATMACVVILAFGNPNYVGANFATVVVNFLLFGLCVIPFSYVLSFLFKSHSSAQNGLVMLMLAGGVLLLMLSFALYAIPSTREANTKYIRHLFRLVPPFCVADTMFWLSVRSLPGVGLGQWEWDVSGYNMLFMSVEALVYFCLTLALEHSTGIRALFRLITRDPKVPPVATEDDPDVAAERERITSGRAEAQRDPIILQGLRKTFPPAKAAVEDLYFAVPAGQCFGFLGVNGAGKTTAIKMLTGDVTPSEGSAKLGGLDLATHAREIHKLIGYCPQFDALHEHMTAREHLQLYGRIRGVPEHRLNEMVEYLISSMTLELYADRPAGTYSGGNKRKLSVAIALVGNPQVVFLDEPSTGMDPVSRRFMWSFITDTMAHRAVILTTHSMEECEALCQRIGILVLGQMKCLGSAQHLKTRFGSGFQLDVSTGARDPTQARRFVQESFKGAEELECYGGSMKYKIPPQDMSLAQMFTLVEDARGAVGIAEYSIGQTTLEQVFIQFARDGDRIAALRAQAAYGKWQPQAQGAPNTIPSTAAPLLAQAPSQAPAGYGAMHNAR